MTWDACHLPGTWGPPIRGIVCLCLKESVSWQPGGTFRLSVDLAHLCSPACPAICLAAAVRSVWPVFHGQAKHGGDASHAVAAACETQWAPGLSFSLILASVLGRDPAPPPSTASQSAAPAAHLRNDLIPPQDELGERGLGPNQPVSFLYYDLDLFCHF